MAESINIHSVSLAVHSSALRVSGARCLSRNNYLEVKKQSLCCDAELLLWCFAYRSTRRIGARIVRDCAVEPRAYVLFCAADPNISSSRHKYHILSHRVFAGGPVSRVAQRQRAPHYGVTYLSTQPA